MRLNKVLLVEDHPVVAMMLADMLEEHVPEVSVTKASQLSACEALVHEQHRLVIFDLNLPDTQGFATADKVRALFPQAQLLAFTGLSSPDIEAHLEEMNIPVVNKSADYHELLNAVMRALQAVGMAASNSTKSKNEYQSNIMAPGSRKPLTWRQVEIMQRIAVGMTAKEAARDLNLSPETVRAHMREVLVRLGAQNRAHAVSIFTKAERQSRMLEEVSPS